jgi:hypothetical protein
MTRFTFTNDQTWGDGDGPRSVSIATENLEGFDRYKAKMGAAVREAHLRLSNAHKNMDDPMDDVVEALAKYFMMVKPYDPADVARVKLTLMMTSLGLRTGQLQVKIHDATPMSKPDGIGYVKMRTDSGLTKANARTNYSYPTSKEDGVGKRIGMMHFKGSALSMGKNNDVATRLVMHEATHKYAGTLDYHYFTTLGGDRGPQQPWGDKDKLLNNADSYAWFAWEAGDPMWTLEPTND